MRQTPGTTGCVRVTLGGMTLLQPAETAPERVAVNKTVLMCRPDYFTVSYRINPWMHPEVPTDTSLAVQQWQTLYDPTSSSATRCT